VEFCDVVLMGVVCQYEDHLEFHLLCQFCGLISNAFASRFQDCIHVGSVVCSILHTCVVERNGEVMSAMCHGEGMRFVKTGSQ
jgi:hypothetical protein